MGHVAAIFSVARSTTATDDLPQRLMYSRSALRRGQHGIGVAFGGHGDRSLLLGMLQRQRHQPIAQAAGRVERLAVVAARQAGRHLGRLVAWAVR